MKRWICFFAAALMLLCAAHAQEDSAVIAVIEAAPAATQSPAGETFSSEDIIVTLPAGMQMLSADALSGYEAAVQDAFPGALRPLLAAANEDASAALIFAVAQSDLSAAEFAREGAQVVLGNADAVTEAQHGANSYAAFTCGIGDQVYQLHFLQGEGGMLVVGASGLNAAELEAMLAGVIY